jgi:hypothetical protein
VVLHPLEIDEALLDQAVKKLSRDKAVGLDLLPDFFFKSRAVYRATKPKILRIFNDWANIGEIPPSMLQGRIIAISKTEAQMPPLPKVRLINVI